MSWYLNTATCNAMATLVIYYFQLYRKNGWLYQNIYLRQKKNYGIAFPKYLIT